MHFPNPCLPNGEHLNTAYPALALSGLQFIITLLLHVCVHRTCNLSFNRHSQSYCVIHIQLPSTQLYMYTPGSEGAEDIVCSVHLHTKLDRESNSWPLARSPTPGPPRLFLMSS